MNPLVVLLVLVPVSITLLIAWALNIGAAVLATLFTLIGFPIMIYGVFETLNSTRHALSAQRLLEDLVNREEVVRSWVETLRESKMKVRALAYTIGSPETARTSTERGEWASYLSQARKFSRKRNASIHLLGPDDCSKLKVLHERAQHGVHVRVHRGVKQRDIRFQICDDEMVVINFHNTVPGKPSERGTTLRSTTVADQLTKLFNRLWDEGQELDDFAKQCLLGLLSPDDGVTIDHLCGPYRLSKDYVQKVLSELIREQRVVNESDRYFSIVRW